jgi:hypothetical protein
VVGLQRGEPCRERDVGGVGLGAPRERDPGWLDVRALDEADRDARACDVLDVAGAATQVGLHRQHHGRTLRGRGESDAQDRVGARGVFGPELQSRAVG